MVTRAVWIFDKAYALPAFLSIASFVRYVDMPVTVIYCGKQMDPEMEGAFSRLSKQITILTFTTRVKVHNPVFLKDAVNRLARMYVIDRFGEDCVWLFDADTAFSEKIQELINSVRVDIASNRNDLPMIWGVKEYERATESYFFMMVKDANGKRKYLSNATRYQHYEKIYGADWKNLLNSIQFNNGVLAFYQGKKVSGLWKANYLRGLQYPGVNPEDDQLPLMVALKKAGCRIHELEKTYNSMGGLDGEYAVYHPFGHSWKKELWRIAGNEDQLSAYGNIVKEHWPKVPEEWIGQMNVSLISR